MLRMMSKRVRRGWAVMALAFCIAPSALADAGPASSRSQPELELVAESPTHLWNAVALTTDGRIFAGLPRWPGFEVTPGLVEIKKDGSLVPYPGGKWNQWTPGSDGRQAFVQVNTMHIFDGRTIWVVDQGSAPRQLPRPGEQKLVQIDTRTDKVVRTITFPEDVLPPGAQLNDLRIHGNWIYLTESGQGSVVVIDSTTGKSIRRLVRDPSTQQVQPKVGLGKRWLVLPDGTPQVTHSDPIELSPGGEWLYYQPASGPLYRVPTAALRDASVSEAELSRKVEFVYDTGTLGGSAMDDKGNIFLSESENPRISVLAPDGSLRVLIRDPRVAGGDAMFITPDRYLYIPIAQVPNLKFLQGPGGTDHIVYPFKIWRVKLPDEYGGPIQP